MHAWWLCFCMIGAVSDGDREDLRAWAPKRPSVTLGDPEKLARSSVWEHMLPTVLVASAVTPGLFTFSIAWSPWWRAVVWQQRAISWHTEILPPACAGKGKGENCSTSLILPESWPPLAGFPGGKGGSPRLVTLPKPLLALRLSPHDQAAERPAASTVPSAHPGRRTTLWPRVWV